VGATGYPQITEGALRSSGSAGSTINMLKVGWFGDVVEPGHELARLGVQREAQANDQAKRGAMASGLDLRQVSHRDARPFGDGDLREPAPVSQFLHPCAEQAPHALVPLVVRHDAIVRTPPDSHSARRVSRCPCLREDA